MTSSDGRFGKKERLVKTKDFGSVYKAGSSFPSGPFVLKTLKNTLSFNRIGFSVGARGIKSAARHNRIKRLFREALRKNKGAVRQGFDMVVVVRKDPAGNFSYAGAEKIFLQLAKKAGL